jgi:hypothetical protein
MWEGATSGRRWFQLLLTNSEFTRIINSGVGFNLTLNLQGEQDKKTWRVMSIVFCALVFYFALHAKTAVYNGTTSLKQNPSTASKLWQSGQKMEPQLPETSIILCWMLTLCLLPLSFSRKTFVAYIFLIPPPSNLPLRHLHRFLRPPPVLA